MREGKEKMTKRRQYEHAVSLKTQCASFFCALFTEQLCINKASKNHDIHRSRYFYLFFFYRDNHYFCDYVEK